MSNPTSNFGWQMPTATDLVTDLPADFEVFGQAVDTTLAELKGGTTGQILSKTSNTDMDFTWTSPSPGDITGVTAGTGISGGGTSGDVTITNSMATAFTTSGDLIQATGSGTFARLGTGTNGQYLTTNGTTNSWGTISTGGMTLLASGSLAATGNTTVSSISQSYKNLIVYIKNYVNQGDYLGLRINGVSSSNSHFYRIFTNASSTTTTYIYAAQFTNNTTDTAFGKLELPNYTNTTTPKMCNIYYNMTDIAGTGTYLTVGTGGAKATTAISSLVFFPVSGTILGGTYEVYGVN